VLTNIGKMGRTGYIKHCTGNQRGCVLEGYPMDNKMQSKVALCQDFERGEFRSRGGFTQLTGNEHMAWDSARRRDREPREWCDYLPGTKFKQNGVGQKINRFCGTVGPKLTAGVIERANRKYISGNGSSTGHLISDLTAKSMGKKKRWGVVSGKSWEVLRKARK